MNPRHWKDFLFLLRSEQRVFIVTILIVTILLGVKWYLPRALERPKTDHGRLKAYVAQRDSIENSKKEYRETVTLEEDKFPTTEINEARLEDWMHLGFSEKQALVINRYREKIGGFRSKEDLLDVFVVDENRFERIEPYLTINLNDSDLNQRLAREEAQVDLSDNDSAFLGSGNLTSQGVNGQRPDNSMEWGKETVLEINSADSVDLISLKGIGPYYASKIIAYRRSLGGYHSLVQLKEVYRMRPETVDNLDGFVVFDTSLLQKININECSFKELLKHPYFDFYYTKKVINYREKNGKYTSLRDLLKVEFLDTVFLSKTKPYLTIE